MPAAKVRSSANTIAALPLFPSDINTAPLFQVSLAKILAKDVYESARVLEACKTRKCSSWRGSLTVEGGHHALGRSQVFINAKLTILYRWLLLLKPHGHG
jgi:hypothetical protein